MKQFIVSLYARSRTLDLDAVSRLLGAEPDGGRRLGELVPGPEGDRSSLVSCWWVDSGAGDEADLEAHTASLAARLDRVAAALTDSTAAGILETSVGIGIMYDTYTTSVRLPPNLVQLAARVGATFEVSTYPTEFAESPDE